MTCDLTQQARPDHLAGPRRPGSPKSHLDKETHGRDGGKKDGAKEGRRKERKRRREGGSEGEKREGGKHERMVTSSPGKGWKECRIFTFIFCSLYCFEK